ncbi:MAG: hypothetical protein JST54_13650 [Deltaproteobacteria bacterium]|nr:hypothetical protein [Deltaproteobacteria bacterium]
MPVPKIPLAEAMAQLQTLGPVRVLVSSGVATAVLDGKLGFEQKGNDAVFSVGCACRISVPRERVRHVVLSEKEHDGANVAHAQLFDGNYDKLCALIFPQGVEGARQMVQKLDGNDFEIG